MEIGHINSSYLDITQHPNYSKIKLNNVSPKKKTEQCFTQKENRTMFHPKRKPNNVSPNNQTAPKTSPNNVSPKNITEQSFHQIIIVK
jgi:hypothetical protein